MNNSERSNYIINCSRCNDSGIIVAMSKVNPSAYAFLCNNCSRAKHKNYPVWNDRFSKDFDVDFRMMSSAGPIKPIERPLVRDVAAIRANDDTLKSPPPILPSIPSDFSDEDLP